MQCKWGSTRVVLLIGRYAFKFPRPTEWRLFLLGLLANMQETLFTTMKDARLCPVIFRIPGGFLNVMPRTKPLTLEEYEQHDVSNIVWPLEVEDKLDSVGWFKGKIVAVDYGN